ncbi:MAG: class B sortase [Firmicutes bacterium]|nr:class B sortase [Bacillota bacterium]
MRAKDYDYYLRRLPDGAYNSSGSLFIDYNCAADFSQKLTVVYGHKMKSGQMFGSLAQYKKQAYYTRHPFMYLYSEQGNYRVDLLYGCVIGAGEWRERAFMYEDNLESLLSYAAYNTTFNGDIQYQATDKLLALSTCSYEFEDARYVVIGVLQTL